MSENRATLLWQNWADKQRELESAFGLKTLPARLLRFQLKHLSEGLYRISRNPSLDEKLAIEVIKSHTARLRRQLYPNPVLRAVMRLKQVLYDQPVYIKAFEARRQQNLAELQGQAFRLGLNGFAGKLENHLDTEASSLQVPLRAQLNGQSGVQMTLNYTRDATGGFALESYRVQLNDSSRPDQQQGFDFPAELGITAKEAVNLLQGRSVCKGHIASGPVLSERWMTLNINTPDGKPCLETFHTDYDYQLKTSLVEHARELSLPALHREETEQALKQGEKLVINPPGGAAYTLEASPENRTLTIRDPAGKSVALEGLIKKSQAPEGALKRATGKLMKVKPDEPGQQQGLKIG